MQSERMPGVVTPEAVSLDLPLAGLGSRSAAAALDVLIQGILLAIGASAAFLLGDRVPSEGAAIAIAIGGLLMITAGYYLLFEGLWEGQTPGKRAAGIRVVTELGQPVTWRHVVIRTLFRVVDMGMFIGPPFMVFTRRSQRLGDLTAGTVVVRRHRADAAQALELAPDPRRDELASSLDTSGVTDEDYALIRSFLMRRAELTDEARAQLASRLAASLRASAGLDSEGLSDETVLEAIVVSRRIAADGPRHRLN